MRALQKGGEKHVDCTNLPLPRIERQQLGAGLTVSADLLGNCYVSPGFLMGWQISGQVSVGLVWCLKIQGT